MAWTQGQARHVEEWTTRCEDVHECLQENMHECVWENMHKCVQENVWMGMPACMSSCMDMPTSHCGGGWWGLWVAGGGCGCMGGQAGRLVCMA